VRVRYCALGNNTTNPVVISDSHCAFFIFEAFRFRLYFRALGMPNCHKGSERKRSFQVCGLLTLWMGYNIRADAVIIQPHLTFDGKGSGNNPLLHFVITSISVTIVARRSQTCCPILTARLIKIMEGQETQRQSVSR